LTNIDTLCEHILNSSISKLFAIENMIQFT